MAEGKTTIQKRNADGGYGPKEVPCWGKGILVVTQKHEFTITHQPTGFCIDVVLDEFPLLGRDLLVELAEYLGKTLDWKFTDPSKSIPLKNKVFREISKWFDSKGFSKEIK